MRKFVLGLVVGGLLGSAMAAGMSWWVLDDHFQHGRYMGRLDGLGEAMQSLQREFGEVPWDHTTQHAVFALKSSVAVAVDVGGIKTVRVVP